MRMARIALGALLVSVHALAVAEPPVSDSQKHILDSLKLKSSAVLVVDQDSGETLAMKNADRVVPVASLTKLMTALVVLDAGLPAGEMLEITGDDVDHDKRTPSRLKVGSRLTRDEMLQLALMSSENRAAAALSRGYPGGRPAFIAQMNAKAQALGMKSTHFADPAGLSSGSVSSARDLHRLLVAANAQPLIRKYTTQHEQTVRVRNRKLVFRNSNRLVRGPGHWDIELQKTGFTNEAGRCLVMQARVANRRLAFILLDSVGKLTRYGDASRVRRKLESEETRLRDRAAAAAAAGSP